jgi:hypothetical protein
MTIGAAGVSFQTVNVTSGDTNAIILEDLTGTGQVSVGSAAGAADSGGMLTTTGGTAGDAIVVRNVQNVDLRNIRIVSSGDEGLLIEHTAGSTAAMDVTLDRMNIDVTTGNGVEVNALNDSNSFVLRFNNGDLEENFVTSVTGAGLFQMRVEDTTIDVGNTDAFATTVGGAATNVDLVLRDVDFLANDGSAASITTSGNTLKTVDLLIDGSSTFNNNSATNPTTELLSSGNTTLNATVQSNTFTNANAGGSEFTFTADGASARARLVLGGDDAALQNTADGGSGDFTLVESNGADFDVFDRDDTFNNLNNNGLVTPLPNAAAFDNLLIAPTPPSFP